MRYKIFIILSSALYSLFLLPGSWLLAQNINVKREITWKTTNSVKNPSEKLFYFDGAIYDGSTLPLYFERFKLQPSSFQPPASSFQVEIENSIYDEITGEELKYIPDSLKIQASGSINYQLSTINKKEYLSVKFYPFRKNTFTDKYEKLVSFQLSITPNSELQTPSSQHPTEKKLIHADSSVLAKGSWYKIAVSHTGIQRLTYQDLANAGINVANINPNNIRIYGNGAGMLPENNSTFRYDDLVQNPISVQGTGQNLTILFYGQGPTIWKYNSTNKCFNHQVDIYSNVNYYFLNTDIGPGLRIQTENSSDSTVTNTVNNFNDYAYHELDSLNLIQSGRQWYGEVFSLQTSYNFNFNFPDINTQNHALLNTSTLARSQVSSNFIFSINGSNFNTTILPIDFANYDGPYADSGTGSFSFTPSSELITVNVTYSMPQPTSIGWLNYIELNVMRNLVFRSGQLIFRNTASVGTSNISQFMLSNANSNVMIWDVTNPVNPLSVQTKLNGSNLSFTLPTPTLKEFIAFDGSSFYTPVISGQLTNQNLHASPQVDMVIVTHPGFYNQAMRIAKLHINTDNMKVIVTTPDIIYNEFSSGNQDITAIRDFMKMFYDRGDTGSDNLPKYLLLIGDASYDYKNRIPENTNFVPAYESPNSLDPTNSYCTDDYYGLLDDGDGGNSGGALIGNLDLGIGRFPVKNDTDVRGIVNKIMRYISVKNLAPGNIDPSTGRLAPSNFADWKNRVCFIADDKESDLFIQQTEGLTAQVSKQHPVYNINKIYLDAYKEISYAGGQRYPDATAAIDKQVDNGAFLINYTGHGGQLGWSNDRIIEITDINSWNNKYNMPIFMTATCEFSTCDNPSQISAGNIVFTNPNGGGIALFTTTRVTFSQTNLSLNQSFLSNFSTKINGSYPRLGDIIRQSKVANNDNQDILNFVLLGDPALRLAYPIFKVATSSVVANAISDKSDTLAAFSQVTVTGSITDDKGNQITSFNGTLFPTVFDKPDSVYTLSNDGPYVSPKYKFALQKSILFKGMASVKNGNFKFSFIVPKDIKYKYGYGKISYYAVSDSTDETGNIIPVIDANGYNDSIFIGGTKDTIPQALTAPVIKLYIDNIKFVSGGNTSTNPLLLAYLYDNYGINTTGNSIGHDITAVLDDSTQNTIVLDDYYQSNLDTYKSGTVKYYFSNLAQGQHTLTLKAWNIFDISSEAQINFFVVRGYKIYAYPTPFSPRGTISGANSTSLCFEHNYSLTDINVNLQISLYSIYGAFICSIDKTVADSFNYNKNAYQSSSVWDGKDFNGNPVKQGIYIFYLNATNSQGLNVTGYGKILVF